ncbi:hypothetical protein H3N56_03060 [Cetobacterium sp. 2A]|uniref:phage minor capsid protein n=1 Tax=Cetobacterium sp. 2A TaxID=2754723 RepID=UPI00163D334C|nr:phage minor capsid protein [Cetobacterium sp. 2A]MBC2855474.1 hypothetical protein [Cetobacterium sp. 2A]
MNKKSTDRLIKLYQETIDNLLYSFEKKLRDNKVIDYEIYLIKSLLKAFTEAKEIRGEIRHSLQEEYIKQKIEEWEKAKPLLSPKQQLIDFEKFTKIDSREIETIYSMFNDKINRAEKGIGRQVRGWFEKEQKAITNATNRATRDQLTSRFMGKSKEEAISGLVDGLRENIYFKLIDKNGNPLKMKIDSYANLSLNSMFQQARNTATINTVKQLESDLVIFSKHYWTCESCAKYAEGRVYSIKRGNKDYPYLYETVPGFIQGYNSLHPNCKHLLSGFFETGRSKEEIDEIKRRSNNHEDNRRDKDREKYNIKQKLNIYNARKRALEIELDRFKGVKITDSNVETIQTLRLRLKNVKAIIRDLNKRLKEL